MATGFCSGMARTCGTCGAVSGAILTINLFTGRSEPGQPVDKNYAAVQKLIQQFNAQFGAMNCQQLLGGVDLGTAEGQQTFREKSLFGGCLNFAEGATRIAMTLLAEAESE